MFTCITDNGIIHTIVLDPENNRKEISPQIWFEKKTAAIDFHLDMHTKFIGGNSKIIEKTIQEIGESGEKYIMLISENGLELCKVTNEPQK